MNWFNRKNRTEKKLLDWGKVTADGFDKKNNVLIHVFNSKMTSEIDLENNRVFILSKFNYFKQHLPKGSKQRFTMDLRGQGVSIERARKFKSELKNVLKNESFEMDFLI